MQPDVAVVLLAGGQGTRFGGTTPKQFLPLSEKPVALYSLEVFLALPQVTEVIIVCAPSYRYLFPCHPNISFALPGERRQDSVYHGIQAIHHDPQFICIHDAARPLITQKIVEEVIKEARIHGAATVGVPVKFTIKEHNGNHFVSSTLDRNRLWEIQTPQVINTSLLFRGFELIKQNDLTVTDDVSLVELLGKNVKLVEGSYTNLKITTPEDMILAKHLIEAHS